MNMQCPKCNSVREFEVSTNVTVTVDCNGNFVRKFDAEGGDIIINVNDVCHCLHCGYKGKVSKFEERAKNITRR